MKISIRIFILMSSPIEILAVIALESNNLLDTGHVVSANPTKLRSLAICLLPRLQKVTKIVIVKHTFDIVSNLLGRLAEIKLRAETSNFGIRRRYLFNKPNVHIFLIFCKKLKII